MPRRREAAGTERNREDPERFRVGKVPCCHSKKHETAARDSGVDGAKKAVRKSRSKSTSRMSCWGDHCTMIYSILFGVMGIGRYVRLARLVFFRRIQYTEKSRPFGFQFPSEFEKTLPRDSSSTVIKNIALTEQSCSRGRDRCQCT